ncbi:hypothetical protein Zmor_002983 [Zophobas morio]|uniref:Uncharacterized protein n=2 Tax=Zophobas morio TaxID=2755281 RepID=A0AA38M0W3_9CUCU|nr:hypothetical protein Zmor_002983 [Zophobas morio]
MQFIIKSRMFNESTQLLDAFWVLPVDLDENVTMSLKCSRIDKRKTQVNSFILNDVEACSTLQKYVGDLWTYIQSKIGMEPGVCPVKMGNYSTENMILDLTKLNVQMILEGRFRTRIFLKHLSKPLYCTDFTIELTPKKE